MSHFPVSVEIDGRPHHGQWTLKQGGKLCVGGFYGSRTVEIGDAQPAALAKEVLRDLVLAWRARTESEPPPARRPSLEDRPFALTVLVDGRSWSGTWRLLGGQVCVSSAYGDRAAPVKRSTPERVAERLLKEMVAEWMKTRSSKATPTPSSRPSADS